MILSLFCEVCVSSSQSHHFSVGFAFPPLGFILFFPLKEEGEYWPDGPRKPKETESEGAKSKKSGEMWERPGLNLSFAVKCSIFKLTVFSKLYSSFF